MCGSYQAIREQDVRPRKARVCEWCGQRIEVGELAHFRAYKFDGEFVSGYMHPECNTASVNAPHDMICDGWSPGDFARGSTEERA